MAVLTPPGSYIIWTRPQRPLGQKPAILISSRNCRQLAPSSSRSILLGALTWHSTTLAEILGCLNVHQLSIVIMSDWILRFQRHRNFRSQDCIAGDFFRPILVYLPAFRVTSLALRRASIVLGQLHVGCNYVGDLVGLTTRTLPAELLCAHYTKRVPEF